MLNSGLVHSTIFTAAKVPDNKVLEELLHGEDPLGCAEVHG